MWVEQVQNQQDSYHGWLSTPNNWWRGAFAKGGDQEPDGHLVTSRPPLWGEKNRPKGRWPLHLSTNQACMVEWHDRRYTSVWVKTCSKVIWTSVRFSRTGTQSLQTWHWGGDFWTTMSMSLSGTARVQIWVQWNLMEQPHHCCAPVSSIFHPT